MTEPSRRSTTPERFQSARESAMRYFDEAVATGCTTFDALPPALRDRSNAISKDLALIARELGAALHRSTLLTVDEAVPLGRAFKGARAALRFRRFVFWGLQVVHDEDIVLGTRPAGESEDYELTLEEARQVFSGWADEIERKTDLMEFEGSGGSTQSESSGIRLFISHVAEERELAAAVVDLIRAGLNLPSAAIRCTSVDGYKLKGGANIDQTLRDELRTCEAFVGVISTSSIQSLWVAFELGARWGSGRRLLPLLAPMTPTSVLGGPLSGIHALSADNAADLHQLVADLAVPLGVKPEPAAAYQRYVDAILKIVPTKPAARGPSGARESSERPAAPPPNLGPQGWMAS